MTKFEQLPNELILICFIYLDFYNIYEIFLHFNQRFQQLIQQHTKIHVDLSSIVSRKFLTFCFQLQELARSNQNYPSSIVAHDGHKLNLIVKDDLFNETFSRLKSLTLAKMDSKTIYTIIFDYPSKLYESLERLNLLVNINEESRRSTYNQEDLCCDLISSKMKLLKYLKLNFHAERRKCKCYASSDHTYLDFDQFTVEDESFSNLETLIIGDDDDEVYAILWFDVLNKNLLPRLPKLRNLMLACIDFDETDHLKEKQILSTAEINPKISSSLKFVKVGIEESEFIDEYAKVNTEFLQKFFLNNKSPETITIRIFIQETEDF